MATDPLRRYQVIEPLGRGGQGRTFRGYDRDVDRDVAIKVLSLRGSDDWKPFDLFEREVAVLAGLTHPGIPAYIDSYASEGTGDYFLVMELVDGEPLSRFVGGPRRLGIDQVRAIFDQILDVLAYLHRQDPVVIHRDIKPANLVLRADGRVVLVDFGGVKRLDASARSSTLIGTFGYMAPEQLYGEATPATDLYALAATIVALLQGIEADRLPHDGLRIAVDRLDVPADLAGVLAAMLEPEPSRRPAGVAAVRRSWRPGDPPSRSISSDSGPDDRELAPSPERETSLDLSRVPPVLSIFIWVLSGLGWGGLLLFEGAILPLVYQVATAVLSKRGRESRRERFEIEFREFRHDLRTARDALGVVAAQTRPGAPPRD